MKITMAITHANLHDKMLNLAISWGGNSTQEVGPFFSEVIFQWDINVVIEGPQTIQARVSKIKETSIATWKVIAISGFIVVHVPTVTRTNATGILMKELMKQRAKALNGIAVNAVANQWGLAHRDGGTGSQGVTPKTYMCKQQANIICSL